jgi:hypothetical protein
MEVGFLCMIVILFQHHGVKSRYRELVQKMQWVCQWEYIQ